MNRLSMPSAPVVGLRHTRTGDVYVLQEDGTTRVGSDPRANHVVIDDSLVSRSHLRIYRDDGDGELIVEDAGSKNGTALGATKIKRAPLRDGHVVRIGGTELQAFADRPSRWHVVRQWLIGEAPAFLAAVDDAARAFDEDRVVVVRGEPGSGRTTIAQALHHLVCGHDAPFTVARFLAPTLYASMSREALWALQRHGTVFLHGLDVAEAAALRHSLRDILPATSAGWLRVVISVGPNGPPPQLPSDVSIVEIPRLRDRADDARLLAAAMVREAFPGPELPQSIAEALLRYPWETATELAFAVSRLADIQRLGSVEAVLREHASPPDIVVDIEPVPPPVPDLAHLTLSQWFERREIPLSVLTR